MSKAIKGFDPLLILSIFIVSLFLVFFSLIVSPVHEACASPGSGWDVQVEGISADFYGIDVVDAGTVWTAGKDGVIFKTIDGGDTWSAQDSSTRNADFSFACRLKRSKRPAARLRANSTS